MNRFSKIVLIITVVLLIAWQLPWCYNFFAVNSEGSPLTLYSTIEQEFVQIVPDKARGIIRRDINGKEYNESEFDEILPLFYARQLISEGRFPHQIHGVKVGPRKVQMNNFTFRSRPYDMNAPKIGLYFLLESMSGRVKLEMPKDVFRMTTEGLEFVDIESNALNKIKSDAFTKAMLKKGFTFPAQEISGNATTRKEYDEGYVMLDAQGKLFHVKQIQGRPYVRAIAIPRELRLSHLFITEFSNRKTLAFMTDAQHHFYVLTSDYRIIKTGVTSFNPETDGIMILGNLFNWTVRVSTDAANTFYAIDSNDYTLIKSYQETFHSFSLPNLSFSSYKDKYIYPRFTF